MASTNGISVGGPGDRCTSLLVMEDDCTPQQGLTITSTEVMSRSPEVPGSTSGTIEFQMLSNENGVAPDVGNTDGGNTSLHIPAVNNNSGIEVVEVTQSVGRKVKGKKGSRGQSKSKWTNGERKMLWECFVQSGGRRCAGYIKKVKTLWDECGLVDRSEPSLISQLKCIEQNNLLSKMERR